MECGGCSNINNILGGFMGATVFTNKFTKYINDLKAQESENIIIDRSPWDSDLPDFVEALLEAELSEFVFSDESTAAMQTLHALVVAGYSVSAITVDMTNKYGSTERIKGLLMSYKI
jgi:hypothetical protein